MAFVPSITPLSFRSTFCGVSYADAVSFNNRCERVKFIQPCTTSNPSTTTHRRAVVMRAKRAPPPVVIKKTRNTDDLQNVYQIWNEIASTEGFPKVSPDDWDSAESTVHLLAQYQPTEERTDQKKQYVGAARLLFVDNNNIRLDRVCVLPEWRQKGIGRALVKELVSLATKSDTHGTIHVHATKGSETGFFSILGFEPVGNERMEESMGNSIVRTMLLDTPTCAPPVADIGVGCVGLHHASLRVSDIERSLAFYGSVGFTVSEKFVTSSGARACFVEGLGTRLEFVECPVSGNAGQISGIQGVPPIGFDRLVFDVTKACTDLELYLQHLARRNGGLLEVAGPPAKQIVGNFVMSVASILDPDGLPIEFVRREARVPGELITKVKW